MADYNWQIKAITRFAKAKISAIVAACGTGKTRVNIKIAILKNLPVIVIAPKNLCKQWKEEIEAVAGPGQDIWVHDSSKEHRNPTKYYDEFKEFMK